jgi:hypothetical protein
MVTPRLALRSPVAACGKTTLIDILSTLVARPEKFDSISTAAIFRLIDSSHPTLLIDEADNLGIALQQNGRLRAVFNSGHRKGGQVGLMEGGRMRKYSTFAPLALALPDTMFGLPRTLDSRSITITMERHGTQRERFDANDHLVLDAAYRQIWLWQNETQLNPDPVMPTQAKSRIADNWRPLLAVADALGWSKKAREAMHVFIGEFRDADAKLLLLRDIRQVFNVHASDRLSTATLLAALHRDDGADWCEFCGIRGNQQPHKLKVSELATMLREFKIRPRTIWPTKRAPETKSKKGYRRADFEQAWRQYCPEDGTPSQSSNVRSLQSAGAP